MISVQIANFLRPYIGYSEQPSTSLVTRYEKAASSIRNSFTLQVNDSDAAYLYLRFKKIKNDTGFTQLFKHPLTAFHLLKLNGYTKVELMEQYIQKVEEYGVNIDESSGNQKAGFSKGPSKMRDNSDSTLYDDDFSSKRGKLVDYIRDEDIYKIRELLLEDNELANLPYLDIYPVHVATDVGMLEVLKLLIQFGANANQRDSDGQTALHYAACNGYFEVAKFLLNSGIDLNVKCNEGLTALDLATDDNIIDLLKVQL